MQKITICALYKFVNLPDYQDLQSPLLDLLSQYKIKGTVLLAEEGINGTIAGSSTGIQKVVAWLKQDLRFNGINLKYSYHNTIPFLRARVKLKKEIVTLGVKEKLPQAKEETYINPKDWNALISDPDITVIDTRNHYEVSIGSFTNATNPGTQSFCEFPDYAAKHLDKNKNKKIAMFCTGGIRCEKSVAYLKHQGFDEVYQLHGGILKYLEMVSEEESLWQGECFVFDERVSVNSQLKKGCYDMCHGCRNPITEEDKQTAFFILGVSCPACYDQLTPLQRKRFSDRQKQIVLAKQRGQQHMGSISCLNEK